MGEKWNDSRPAEKLLALYTMMLVSPYPMSLTTLANKLGCSKQTIKRLVDQLESSKFGKIITDRAGRECIYSLARPERKPCVSLNAEGLGQLALCREFLLRLLPPGMARQMETSLNQAAAYLPDNAGFISGIGTAFSKGRINYTAHERILQTFIRAISTRKVCKVTYRARRHMPPKVYDYAPKRLVAFHESIFVQGYIVNDKGAVARIFDNDVLLALHRVIECVPGQRKTDKLPDLTPDQTNFLGVMQDEPFDVSIYFHADAATYASEREWSHGQKIEDLEDGSIILHITASNKSECLAWILGFGDKAEVLEPAWFRDYVFNKIKSMSERYSRSK